MRVVAGSAGGLRLRGPANEKTKPTTDKVREATFNSLQSMDAIDGASVVDLFAGTGACGIEALSRGAGEATFVDRDRSAVEVIRENLASTKLAGTVVNADAMNFLQRGAQFGVAFADPPYEFDEWPRLMELVDAKVAVCESNKPLGEFDGWQQLRERRYGGTYVSIYESAPAS